MVVGISMMLAVAAIHAFRIGTYLNGDLYIYYYSYASDVMIPFGMYFLLSMNQFQYRFLEKWYVKALIVFGLATLTEILQIFGVYALGVTFDIFDILMFGIGVLIAVLLDKLVFEHFIPYWRRDAADSFTI